MGLSRRWLIIYPLREKVSRCILKKISFISCQNFWVLTSPRHFAAKSRKITTSRARFMKNQIWMFEKSKNVCQKSPTIFETVRFSVKKTTFVELYPTEPDALTKNYESWDEILRHLFYKRLDSFSPCYSKSLLLADFKEAELFPGFKNSY